MLSIPCISLQLFGRTHTVVFSEDACLISVEWSLDRVVSKMISISFLKYHTTYHKVLRLVHPLAGRQSFYTIYY